MTDSLGELRAVLAAVGERLGEALGYAATARDRLVDAVGRAHRPRRAALRTAGAARAAPRGRRAGPRAAPDQQRRGRRRRHRRAAVSVGRKARRERISAAFDAFHATVRGVLGAATRLTEQRPRRSTPRPWSSRGCAGEGLDAARADPGLQGVLANPRLAAAVARVAADRGRRVRGVAAPTARRSGPARPDGRPRPRGGRCGAAAGSRGTDAVSERRRYRRPVPQLWRIGTGAVVR